MRHRMSLRFRSTAWAANRVGSIMGARSANLGPSLPCGFFSQPTAEGRLCGSTVVDSVVARQRVPIWLFHAAFDKATSESRQRRIRTVEVVDGYKARRYARRLRRGHPGLDGSAEGSTNPTICCRYIYFSWVSRRLGLEYLLLPEELMRKMNQRPLQERGKRSLTCLFVQGSTVEAFHAGVAEHEW